MNTYNYEFVAGRNLREEHSALKEQRDKDILEKWKLDEELK